MFDKLKNVLGKGKNTVKILAPLDGEVIPVTQVNDPTFSEEMLGKGVAIRPSGSRVVSPVDGKVSQMFNTGHAVTLTSEDGVEILIHVGLDTIKLKGEHYTIRAKNGDDVKVGDVLMEFDPAGISAAGYDTVTPVVICNFADYKGFNVQTGKTVKEGDEIIVLEK
jgi:PTS system beta-glucosides-specific IIC component